MVIGGRSSQAVGCVSSVSGGIFRAELRVVFFFCPIRDTPKGYADSGRRHPLVVVVGLDLAVDMRVV